MRRNCMDNGVKFDTGKPEWTLLPFEQLEEVVEVLTAGAQKYAPDNWQKVPNAHKRYLDACMRHIKARISGEYFDKETKLSHTAHAICCLLFLQWHDDNNPEKE
jgi:hypothetical protein